MSRSRSSGRASTARPQQRGGNDSEVSVADARADITFTALIAENYAKLEPASLNHPLDERNVSGTIRTLLADVATITKDYKRALEILVDVGAEMAECKAEDEIVKADEKVRQVIAMMTEADMRKSVLEDIRERAAAGEEVKDVAKMYEDGIKTKKQAWDQLSLRKKFAGSDAYRDFRVRIWEASGEEGTMPSVRTYLPAEEGVDDEESSDEELEVAGTSHADYKCPLCISTLKKPVKSKLCIHHYCGACFRDYFSQRDRTYHAVKCPVTGCPVAGLMPDSVEPDEAFERRMQMHERKQRARAAREAEEDGNEEMEEELVTQADGEVKPANRGAQRPQATQRGTQRRRAVVVDDEDEDED